MPTHDSRRIVLPRDVLVQIILWVEDTKSFFSFLDALHKAGTCGPLQPLWQLGLLHTHEDLWPRLRLSSQMLERSRERLEAILQYIPHVEILWAEDIDWLCQHLSPSMYVKWHAPMPLGNDDQSNWFAKWAQLPLNNVIQYSHPITRETSPDFFDALRHCHHLVRLSLKGYVDIATVFELAASSTQLMKLDLSGGMGPSNKAVLTDLVVTDAMQWLAKAPVRKFRLSRWRWDPQVDVATQEAFYSALFRCPTLTVLDFSMCHLGSLDLTTLVIPPALHKLRFISCCLSPDQISSLAEGLAGSSLQTLRIRGDDNETTEEYYQAFGKLLEAVTQSTMKTLDLVNCSLNDTFWGVLNATRLQRSKLARIVLARNRISDASIVANLVPAIQSNRTLNVINLDGNFISSEGIKSLLLANQARGVPLDELSVRNRFEDEDVALELQALANECGVATLKLGRIRVPRG
ncbi:Aste57867_22646 [Aphanomyces stellatus]|uniref:Aste57867_22646 protein n=1 Tax=Aphanomyces stellatus TaxID=120398 RepID=A0A485LM78_9STRA|nr:hypothetical protein As57867_022576 [Aphanomyces stellatus]VFT99300.1 Aste57867_22646 [Aphanomyces stellatus]